MHNRQRHIRRARKGRDSAVNADRCARGTEQSVAAAALIAQVPSERHILSLQPTASLTFRHFFLSLVLFSRRPSSVSCLPPPRSSPTLASFQIAVRNHRISLPSPVSCVVPLPFGGTPDEALRRSRITFPSPFRTAAEVAVDKSRPTTPLFTRVLFLYLFVET